MLDLQDVSVLDKVNENQPVKMITVDLNRKPALAYVEKVTVKNLKKPVIVEPQTETISPVIQYCIKILKEGNIEEQRTCLNLIYRSIDNPKTATQFLDKEITDALFSVAKQDVSKYKGPTFTQKRLRKKLEEGKTLSKKDYEKAYTLSEREFVQKNKFLALAIIARLQNVLYKETVKRSNLHPSFQDMPAVPELLDLYNNYPDKEVRFYALGSIFMLHRPEFQQDIVAILKQAEKSQDKAISKLAQQALQKLNEK